MSHTYHKIWVHLVWSTANWEPYLQERMRPSVFKHIVENASTQQCHIEAIGGLEDHIHCLIGLPPKLSSLPQFLP